MTNNFDNKKKVMLLVLGLELVALLFSALYPNVYLLQSVSTFTIFGLPAIIYSLYSDSPLKRLSLDNMPTSMQWMLLLIFACSAFPASNFLSNLNDMVHLPSSMTDLEITLRAQHTAMIEASEALMRVDNILGLLINITVMGIVAAVCEELFFRAMLQQWLAKKINIHIVIMLVSILFSILHFDFYGFIPRMIISIFYGYILYYSASLWSTILTHFINNSLYITIIYLQHNYDVLKEVNTFGNNSIIGSISFIVTILAIIIMRQKNSLKT